MKRHLTVTPDNKPAGVRVILASRKGYILYGIGKDGNKKGRRGWEPRRRQAKETNDSISQRTVDSK